MALARLKPYPDLRVGAAWRHFNDTDDNAVRLNFAVPLPFFDRNVGGISEAQAARAKVDAEYATGKAALVLTLDRAYETLTSSMGEIGIAALPNARQAQQAMESGYAQGRFSLLELLDVQNTLTQAGLRELEALTNLHTSVATIEGLTGTPLGLTREVAISDAKIAAAGIELQTASAGVLRDGLLLNGVIQPNQETLVQVTPRFAGVIKELRKRIGDQVNKGDTLATVESNQSLTTYELKARIAGTIIDGKPRLVNTFPNKSRRLSWPTCPMFGSIFPSIDEICRAFDLKTRSLPTRRMAGRQ